MTLDVDVKGDAYEGLLERNAEDLKSGAGQYFTPRPLIRGDRRGDAARAGDDDLRPGLRHRRLPARRATSGSSSNSPHLDPDQREHLRFDALKGWEIVDNTARLCVMNLLLHGIGAEDAPSPIVVDDALEGRPGRALRHGADEPAVRAEVVDDVRERGGRGRARGPGRRPRRLLGLDLEQAAQLPPAREDAAEARRPRGDRRARTTSSSRAARARRSGASSCTSATSTRCCACRPASSTRRA